MVRVLVVDDGATPTFTSLLPVARRWYDGALGAWRPEESAELAEAETEWARRLFRTLEGPRDGGVYVNFLDADDGGRVGDAYGDRTYRRLAQVKAAYDPDNVFHRNQNIHPA